MAGRDLTDEEAQALGLSDAPPPQDSTPQDSGVSPVSGAPPLRTAKPVVEPSNDTLDSLGVKHPAAPTGPRDLSDEEANALGLNEAPAPTSSAAFQESSFAAWKTTHDKATPEESLEVAKYMAATGKTAEEVQATLPELRRTVDQQQTQNALARAPGLSRLLEKPVNAPLVRDDLHYITQTESGLLGDLHHIGKAFVDGLKDQEFAGLTTLAGLGLAGPDVYKRISEIQDETERESDEGWSNWTRWMPATARAIPYVVGAAAANFVGGAIGGATGSQEASEAGGVAGAETGGKTALFAFNWAENFGPTYWKLKSMKNPETGQHLLDDDEARLWAGGASAIAAYAMGVVNTKVLGLKVAGKSPGFERLLGKLGKDTISEALSSPSAMGFLKTALPKFGTHLLDASLMMAATSAANTTAEQLAKASNSNEGVDLAAISKASGQSFLNAMIEMPALVAFGVRQDMRSEAKAARARIPEADVVLSPKPQEDAMRLALAVDGAQNSKLLEREPEKFEEMVRLGQAGKHPNVFIDPEAWQRFAEKQGKDPGKLAADVIGDGGLAFTESATTGGDVKIPVEKYLSKLKDFHEELGPDVRLRPEVLSLNQASALLEKRVKEAASEAEADPEFKAAGDVYRDVYEKQIGAGVPEKVADANASMWGAFFRNVGRHIGTDAKSAYDKLTNVSVYGPGEEKGFDFGLNAPPSGLEEARAAISRMGPENRAEATAWLEYSQGERTERPQVSPEMEKRLARFGVVDPVNGFTFGEDGRDMARATPGRRKANGPVGAVPEEIQRAKDNNDLDTYNSQAALQPPENPNLPAMREAHAKLSPEERARELHLDHVTGVREADVFDETPVPEGKVAAVITSPSVKGTNDHPTAGGHNVANALLTEMARAVSKDHQEAARGGTNFRVLLDADKADAQLKTLLERVRRRLGPGIDVVGAHGKDVKEASAKLRAQTDAARAKGELPERGKLRPELDVSKLAFEGKKVSAKPPLEHVSRMKAMSVEESFKRTYQDHVWVTREGKRVAEPTGLLTDKGFKATPERAHTIAFDLVGLGKVPEAVGDEMVLRFGRALREAGGDHTDGTHKSGDEFAAKHDSQPVLERLEARLGRILEAEPIHYVDPTTGEERSVRVRYRHGIGVDYTSADRDLNARRRAEEAGGGPERSGLPASEGGTRGEARASDAGRRESPGDVLPWENDLEGGGAVPGAEGNGSTEAGSGRGVRGGGEAEAVDRLDKLYQPPDGGTFTLEKKGDRGYIEFSAGDGTGKPRRFDIHLLEGSDKSTFAHESAHFFSEVIADAARLPEASEQLKKDYQAVLDFMGHASHEERRASSAERKQLAKLESPTPEQEKRLKELEAKEERFSYAWETYLLEGKAPTSELVRPFARFKNWLTKIYRGISGIRRQFKQQFGEELNVSPEIRDVFNRLLTAEDEVQKAEDAQASQPFQEAQAHMTPEELVDYVDATDRARDIAEQEMLRRIVSGQRAENTAFMKGERERMRAQVDEELDANPVYGALKAMQKEGPLGDAPMKLNREELVRRFGADFVKGLPRDILAKKGEGVSADEAALRTGWDDGEAMVRALATSVPRDVLAEQETQRRMEDAYGPTLLDNGPWLANEALDATHNVQYARKAVLELKALQRALGAKGAGEQVDKALKARLLQPLDINEVRTVAISVVEAKSVGELLKGDKGLSGAYLRAERKASKGAIEAAAKGDFVAAIVQKERAILNKALFRESSELREEMQKAEDKLKGTRSDTWRAFLGKADPAYRDAHDAILQAIGMQEGAPGLPRPSLETLFAKATADAQVLGFDVDGLRELAANPKPWDELSVEQARNVRDAVENIRTAARETTTLLVDGKRVAREELLRDMEETISKRKAKPRPPRDPALTPGLEKDRRTLGSIWWQLLTPESLVSMLDAHEEDGPFRRTILDEEKRCRDKERGLKDQFLHKLVEAWNGLPKELQKRKSDLLDLTKELPLPADIRAELGEGPVSRASLWMMALNMGNEGNIQRLTGGYEWTKDQVMRVLNREMTKPEWDFVQKVWDTLDGIHPHLAEVQERATGLPLGKVVATPVETPHGTYRGGYFPAKEDPRAKTGPVRKSVTSVADIFGESYSRPSVETGHTKARATKADYAVNLDWSVVPSHLAQSIHDAAYRGFIIQTGRLFLDRDFINLTKRYVGDARAKQLVPWLEAVANASADSVPSNMRDEQRFLAWVRGRAARQVMGGALPSIAKHFTDPLIAPVYGLTNPGDVAMAQVRMTNPITRGETIAFAREASSELRARQDHATRKLEQELRDIGRVANGKLDKAAKAHAALADTAMEAMALLHDQMDKHVTTITWTAAYTEAQRAAQKEGLSIEEAKAHAVKKADDVVRKIYPSSEMAQMAPALRNKTWLGGALMFTGFANKLLNLKIQAVDKMLLKWDDPASGLSQKAGAAAKLGASLMGSAILLGMGNAFLGGRGKKEDEDNAEWAGRTMLAEPFGEIPLVGKLAEAGADLAVTGEARKPNLSGNLAADLAGELWDAATKSHENESDEEQLQRYMETLLTVALKGSAKSQIHRTGGYIRQLATGEEQPDASPSGALDVASGLIYGKREKQGLNPISGASALVSQ